VLFHFHLALLSTRLTPFKSHWNRDSLNSHKGDLLTVHCISGTFPTKDVSKKSDMAMACMTYCNGALDCGAIFIQVPTVIFFGVLTYIANTYIMLQQHSSCDEKLFLSV
jgi:hypothetical protein